MGICERCDGRGEIPHHLFGCGGGRCDDCGGTGEIAEPVAPEPPPATVRNGLIHGLFRPLKDKLDQVRSWPGVTDEDIRRAVREGQHAVYAFDRDSPSNPLLDIVVCVYKMKAPETVAYARDRMVEALGDKFWYAGNVFGDGKGTIMYMSGTCVPDRRLRIECVDLGYGFDPSNGRVLDTAKGTLTAHAAVLFAAAQDPTWVRRMDGVTVPYVAAGGFEICTPGYKDWEVAPHVRCTYSVPELGICRMPGRYHQTAVPLIKG